MALSAAQFQLVTRAHYGLVPRPPRSKVPAITQARYPEVIKWWTMFDKFKAWRDIGGTRPSGIWTNVPKFAWQLLLDIRKKYPLKNVKPKDPTPPTSAIKFSLAPAQSWFIIADAYWEAITGENYFGRAFVADDAYPAPTREEIAVYRSRGIRTAVWGDSRPTGGTTTAKIIALANELKVDRCIFQAESLSEYRASAKAIEELGGLGHILIVNLTQMKTDAAIWKDLTQKLNTGTIYAMVECYKNCGWGGPNWYDQVVACSLGATYRDAECPGMSYEEYMIRGYCGAHRDSWYTAQWTTIDYAKAR